MVPSLEEHTDSGPQPLPPSPRQPFTQARDSLHTRPDAAPPQPASSMHWEHLPTRSSVELQIRPPAQPLPSSPLQPGLHVRSTPSQMMPLSASPQSASVRHSPQVLRGEQLRERQTAGVEQASRNGMPQRRSASKHFAEMHSESAEQLVSFGKPQT